MLISIVFFCQKGKTAVSVQYFTKYCALSIATAQTGLSVGCQTSRQTYVLYSTFPPKIMTRLLLLSIGLRLDDDFFFIFFWLTNQYTHRGLCSASRSLCRCCKKLPCFLQHKSQKERSGDSLRWQNRGSVLRRSMCDCTSYRMFVSPK